MQMNVAFIEDWVMEAAVSNGSNEIFNWDICPICIVFEVLGFLGIRSLQACPLTKSGSCHESVEACKTEILKGKRGSS